MSAYHNRRSRVLIRLAKMHPDEFADLMALERTIEGLDPGPVRAVVAKCGTRAGYERHLRNKEKTCEACRSARNAYQRDRNNR